MLDRAIESTDENEQNDRITIPDIDTRYDETYTIVQNFSRIADTIRRDENELLSMLKGYLATSGSIDDQTVRFKGKFSADDISEGLDEYLEKYVLCSSCESPDTRYEDKPDDTVIRCTACGHTETKPGGAI